jgi:trk system potassium uptake protein TrkH
MARLTGSIVNYPARVSIAWYLGLIVLGAMLLAHPMCQGKIEDPISSLDAVFTATSASCVTGLAIRSTEYDFNFVGQLVILLLIQLGGIGIMTVTTFVMTEFGSRPGLRQRAVVSATLGGDDENDLPGLIRSVLAMTFFFESAGFLILFVRNLFHESMGDAAWNALFHSVSAFCNAGFSLHDDSMVRYQTDPVVNVAISLLVIIGGLGFPVISDIRRNWHGPMRERLSRLHLHSKFMLIGTLGLLSLGTIVVLVFEWNGVLKDLPLATRPMVAFFHSMSCRTAGFNSVDLGQLTNAMIFISVLLMMIGAGPCSTAGGFKVSTVMVLLAETFSTLRGRTEINMFGRRIPRKTVERAISAAMVFAVIAVIALSVLLMLDQSNKPHSESQGVFLDATFEVISALATVGLTLGYTTELSEAGRWVVIVLMFIGRLGPITAFIAISRTPRKDPIRYPEESPVIG